MTKKMGPPLPQMPGVDPVQSTMANSGSPIEQPDVVVADAPGPSGWNDWWAGARPRVPFSGGTEQAANTGAGKSYDPEEMLNAYLPDLPPETRGFIRTQLKDAETKSGKDYHTAIDELVKAHPELTQYTPWAKYFPAQKAGQLDAKTLGALTQWSQNYQKPLMETMAANTAAVTGALQGLMPRLPKSYQALMQTQMPILQNLPNQISTMLSQADPGLILSAYTQAAQPQQTAAAANSAFSGLLGGLTG